jgi:magnesium transporter
MQVDEHTTLLLEAARLEADPHAARRANLCRASTLRSRQSHHSEILSRSSVNSHGYGPLHLRESHIQEAGSEAPQLHLRHHMTPDGDADDFSLSFDSDVQSTREIVEKTEEPGMDSLRGTFGAIGTIIRAKRRMRALSAASHHTQTTGSQHSTEVGQNRTSTNAGIRPSWLSGHWSTPKASRFQPMHSDDDIEKGHVKVVGSGSEKGPHIDSSSIVSAPSPITFPHSLSPEGHAATSSKNPLHAQPSVTSGNNSILSDGSGLMDKHIGSSLANGKHPREKDRFA